jgi:hypothetical protein
MRNPLGQGPGFSDKSAPLCTLQHRQPRGHERLVLKASHRPALCCARIDIRIAVLCATTLSGETRLWLGRRSLF